jgi:hypothetical protein
VSQRDASAAATTKSETFYGVDLQCANMFPPKCGAGGICEKPRSSSLSWQQLESWRRRRKRVDLNDARTDRTNCLLRRHPFVAVASSPV